MDYPLAVAIAFPASTLIVTCGTLIKIAMNRNRPAPPVSRKVLDGILNKKFEKVVYIDRCDAISDGIKSEMALTRDVLEKGIKSIKEEIRNNR